MNRIKECRMNARLSQKYVAVTLGVAAPSVSNWESGKTQPTPENFRRLSELFGVSLDYLLGKTDVIEETKKQPPAVSEELDDDLISMLMDLDPQEAQRVRDFVEGLKAARAD